MDSILETIGQIGLVPLVVLQDAADAVPLAKALAAGGVPVAEVTFRTAAACDSIAAIARDVPEVTVGAGTVHTPLQAQQAVEAGARFIVTPGFQPSVIRWCLEHGVAVVPGTVSPADVEQAMEFGLELCKFFPAEAYGGVRTLKALAGPYAGMRFMPTGGVNEENLLSYLSLPNVAAAGGSFTCPDALVAARDWAGITALCRRLVNRILGFELAHVGINTGSAEEAKRVAERFAMLFSLPVAEHPGSYFAGSAVEVIKGDFLGTRGHIAVNTRDIDRAVAYLKRMGVGFNEETACKNDAGQLSTIYLEEEIGGFAVHLRRK